MPPVWDAELGGGGWGDDKKQFYTASPANAALTGDGPAITARADASVPGGISSARRTTRGKVAFRYWRFAARIRVPSGVGVWPAFWMLGTDIDEVGWPACGDGLTHLGVVARDCLALRVRAGKPPDRLLADFEAPAERP